MGKKYYDYNDIEYKGIRYVQKCMMILMKIIIRLVMLLAVITLNMKLMEIKIKYLNNLIDSHKSQDEWKIKLNGNQVFFL